MWDHLSQDDLSLMIAEDRNIHAILLNSNPSNVPVASHHIMFLLYFAFYSGHRWRKPDISAHALNLARTSGDQKLVGQVLFSLALVHGRASEHGTAEQYYAESYGLLSQLTDSDSRQLGLTCGLSLAQCRLSLNQPLQPIIEFLENLQVAFSDDSQRASIKKVLGGCLRYGGQFSAALDTLQEAKDLFIHTGDVAEAVEVLRDISCVYYVSSKFEESLASILEAREVAESSGIPTTDKSAYINIQYGRCLMSLRRYMEALPIFEECLSIFESLGDLSTAAECFKHLGFVHASQANYLLACAAFESAIAKYSEYGATARENEILDLERFLEIFEALSAE
jgi:hypothetical protein